MNTPENIEELGVNQIFVFGSNLAGIHGAGAALLARTKFGAQSGVGFGSTGKCFAIPTKDNNLKVLRLSEIFSYVDKFLDYANDHPELEFLVTKIGCGLAGYSPKQIAPMFMKCPGNITLPVEFTENLPQLIEDEG